MESQNQEITDTISDGASFRSVLFPPNRNEARAERQSQPPCFNDLNLDQIVSAIVDQWDATILLPFFYSTYRDVDVIRHRQAVFSDLERTEVSSAFPPFCELIRSIRANLSYAEKIDQKRHRDLVILRAINLYGKAVKELQERLKPLSLLSAGLNSFQDYLERYIASPAFSALVAEGRQLEECLSKIHYGMLFRGDKVTVRKYASEADYAVTILDRFARFKEVAANSPAPKRPGNDFSLNHIEEGILEFVSLLFPRPFNLLEDYVLRHQSFFDDTIATFDREIGFYVAYLNYIGPLKAAGLPFCYPEVSSTSKQTSVSSAFDLALAAKLSREGNAVVCNDFNLSGAERMIVVSGPNQGGKTTFARMFGQLHFLAGLGCPVPGTQARLFLADQVFTHFEREENVATLRGKLEDELVRLYETCQAMTPNSVLILNEIFNSTGLEDQILLSTNILRLILAADAIGICVTFIDSLSTLNEKTVSMVSAMLPNDPAQRTFQIVRRAADGLAYALSLAEKHGVTYELLRKRMSP